MSKPCSKCKGEMSKQILDPFHGEEGGLTLGVHQMPSLVCGQGHKRFIHVEFAAQLMDLMASPETFNSIPSATKKGLFKKRYHCPQCDVELPALPTGQEQLEVVAELNKAEPFKVLIEVPVFQCNGCGKASIHSAEEAAGLAFKATAHAYRSIDIHPT
jgi:hypothetical protein